MTNYRNINNGEIISETCYNKLPYNKKIYYTKTSHEVTHVVSDDSDDFLTTAIVIGVVAELLSDISTNDNLFTPDSSSNDNDNFSGFGGGEMGGGGAGGDF